MTERVLIIIKPDGMCRNLAGPVLARLMGAGLKLIAAKVVWVTRPLAEAHYAHLQGRDFYEPMIDFMMGARHGASPVLAMIFLGEDAVARARALAGATNPEQADPMSIRGSLGRITTDGIFENVVHVSSDRAEAGREIALWFPEYDETKETA